MLVKYDVISHKREELINISHLVDKYIKAEGIKDGVIKIFVPHTTAAVTINEKADPDVSRDIIHALKQIIPLNMGFHHFEGNSDAHTKTALIGVSEEIIVENGKPLLGTWQTLFFCEFDGPRHRKIYITSL